MYHRMTRLFLLHFITGGKTLETQVTWKNYCSIVSNLSPSLPSSCFSFFFFFPSLRPVQAPMQLETKGPPCEKMKDVAHYKSHLFFLSFFPSYFHSLSLSHPCILLASTYSHLVDVTYFTYCINEIHSTSLTDRCVIVQKFHLILIHIPLLLTFILSTTSLYFTLFTFFLSLLYSTQLLYFTSASFLLLPVVHICLHLTSSQLSHLVLLFLFRFSLSLLSSHFLHLTE